MKKRYFAFSTVIIAILLVSIFISLPREQPASPETQPINNDPTNSPHPTGQPSKNNSGGNNIFSTFGQAFNQIAMGASQLLEPSKPPGVVGSAQTINSSVWRAVAENAWQYFQVGVGFDGTTGLPGAGLGYPYFTDWDLGVYIQAVLDAQKIGIIKEGEWNANARLEKVVQFLEKRDLTSDKLPFWWYEAGTGKKWEAGYWWGDSHINVADTGRLLVALNNLKAYNPSLAGRIDNIVKVRMNYTVMWSSVYSLASSNNIYDYYVASGFASFWPEKFSSIPGQILTNIVSAPKIVTHGVQLPTAKISCEPLLLSIFDFKQQDPRLTNLARDVYLAHEARYNATKIYTAFSEGNSGLNRFIYEWVVLPDGKTWRVHNPDGTEFDSTAVIYNKVAFGFLSIYKTEYARNMVVHLENALPQPAKGYNDGIDDAPEDYRRLVLEVGSNSNGLILSAARHAMIN